MTVVGMEGMYRWMRLRVLDATAAALVAPAFAMSGHFAVAYFRGWIGFFGFELAPFVFFGVTLAARGRVAWLAVASIAFGVVVYLRRTGAIPRTTAMFVRLERRKSNGPAPPDTHEAQAADRQVIASSFYLSDAPEGQLVRDSFGVHLGKAAPGVWDVFLGFGHVSGRRGRAKLVDEGKAEASEDRVSAGSFTVAAP